MIVQLIVRIFYCMRSREVERRKPQFFHQKGWIANNFTVKTNLAAILRTRQKNHTDIARPTPARGATPIHHHRSTELASKPSSAPSNHRRNHQPPEQTVSALACLYDDLLCG